MKKNRNSLARSIASDALMFLAILIAFTLRWVRRAYPMQHQYTVFFVLSGETSGHNEGFAASLIFGFIVPSILVFALYRLALCFVQKKVKALSSKVHLAASAGAAIFMTALAVFLLKAYRYPAIIAEAKKEPVSSQFYQDNYFDTKKAILGKTGSGKTARNLVMIFMESMETTYFDVAHGGVFEKTPIPRLQAFAQSETFFGGGKNIEGTSWTVAGLLSKLGGLPYYNPFNKAADGTVTGALTGAAMTSDILALDGYECIFSMGSEKYFENRDALLESHHFQIHDIDYYKKSGLLAPDYKVFWGFEDEKLFTIAKGELSKLGEGDAPFFYGLLTVDTHFPNGFLCKNCKRTKRDQMLDVLTCADDLVGSFVDWIRAQKWGADTLIAIAGDHNFLDAPCNNFIEKNSTFSKSETEKKRKFFFCLIDGSGAKNKVVAEGEQASAFLNEASGAESEIARGSESADSSFDKINEIKSKEAARGKKADFSLGEANKSESEIAGGASAEGFGRNEREFSSFDIMPTILTALGYKLQSGRAALGVALQTGKKTLIELVGQEALEKQIMKKTKEYDALK